VDKHLLPQDAPALNRRQFNGGLVNSGLAVGGLAVGGMALSGAIGAGSSAQAQSAVSVDKLMAKGPLPDITVGNKDAKVTLVEYASMSCPHCANFHKNVYPKLKKKYIDEGKVLMILREFPLNEIAIAVSMLTRCAGDNDKTVALVDVYYEHQDKWLVRGNAEKKLFELAKQAGFTRESFQKCLSDEKLYANLVKQRDIASKDFGVNRTPSFFVNGQPVTGDILNIDTFAGLIDPLLKKSG